MGVKVIDYGTCIQQYNMGSTMRLVTGIDCLADDLLVRITTPGRWYDDTGQYGYDVNLLVNAAVNGTNVSSNVLARLEAEVRKDPRVKSSKVTSTFSNGTLSVYIAVTGANGDTFTLIGKTFGDTTTAELLYNVVKG